MEFTYDDLMNIELKLVDASDKYKYNTGKKNEFGEEVEVTYDYLEGTKLGNYICYTNKKAAFRNECRFYYSTDYLLLTDTKPPKDIPQNLLSIYLTNNASQVIQSLADVLSHQISRDA